MKLFFFSLQWSLQYVIKPQNEMTIYILDGSWRQNFLLVVSPPYEIFHDYFRIESNIIFFCHFYSGDGTDSQYYFFWLYSLFDISRQDLYLQMLNQKMNSTTCHFTTELSPHITQVFRKLGKMAIFNLAPFQW